MTILHSRDSRPSGVNGGMPVGALETVAKDVVYTLRMARRQPTFVLLLMLSLGLGIGANTAVFSVVSAAFLNTLPISDPETLTLVQRSSGTQRLPTVSYTLRSAPRPEPVVPRACRLQWHTIRARLRHRQHRGAHLAPVRVRQLLRRRGRACHPGTRVRGCGQSDRRCESCRRHQSSLLDEPSRIRRERRGQVAHD